MSDHAWTLENLAAYLADGLESAERERLEQHTAACASCAAALAEARAVDAALSGLFVETRPSAALEDNIIQTLRRQPPSDEWRLPLPAWLGIVAAALVLVGFTGAVASQILDHNGLPFPLRTQREPSGAMAESLQGYERERKDAEQLAEEARQSAVNALGSISAKSETHSDRLPHGSRQREFTEGEPRTETESPPAKLPEPIFDGTSNTTAMGADTKNRMPSNGQVPGGMPPGGMGMMGGMGGMTGGMLPGWPYPPGAGAVATAAPTNNYYKPGEMLDQPQPPAGEGSKNSKGAENKDGKPTEPSATGKDSTGGQGKGDNKGPGQDGQGQKEPGPSKPEAPKPPRPQGQDGPRKIVIRSGEVEYEVQSFDAAVATITRLIKSIKGGFVATVNSDKLANGKVRGSVVVRVPPENLDELILNLRTDLGKSGELKNQRISSLDITKQYTDLESRLKAARAMEERLLGIIKNGKGEIKDLLAVEKELGEWRTRIEEVEGTLRYYANQVSLSTLTITLYEKEIQAPFGIVEREQVQMGIEVEDVDKAYQAAQKAVREAKGRITRADLQQPSEGQFTARLDFEVAPDAAGPLRDRLKQLGTVARFDVSRQEQTEGGTGKPTDGKTTRKDTHFQVSFYNLTNVAPRETVQIHLASEDVEAALKKLLARVEKAAGRVVASNLSSARGDQAQALLQFEVKSAEADAVLEDVKAAGEVMRLSVTESTDRQNTTAKKRGFQVQLLALAAAAARETDEIQLACADVATSYRTVQEAVLKAKGRVRKAQLNEQDRRRVTATLDFEIRRADEAVVRAALATAGDVYTRKANRAADNENVVDSKVHWQVSFINQASIPARETYTFGVEVADVDQTATMLSALVGDRQGRVVQADIARERSGRVTGKLIYDVPLVKAHELLDALKSAGTVRVQQSAKHPEVPDSPLAVARVEVTLSNKELIVPTDEGFGASVRHGLSDSFAVLSWSLRLLILGLCVLLPWALVVWGIYRLVVRMRRRSTPAAPAA